jgi:hypothetical protein
MMTYSEADMRHVRLSRAWRRLVVTLAFTCLIAARVAAGITVLGPLNEQVELQPGARHSGVIVLSNGGDQPEDVKLTLYDYRSSHTGEHFYTDVGTVERSNAEWIDVSPRRFVIPAGGTYTVSFTIDVPVDESLEGTYWSILMIEPVPPESVESPEYQSTGAAVGIASLLRYAFTIVTTIGATGSIEPEVIGATLSYAEDVPTLNVDIRNVGTRILRIAIWAELYSGNGTLVGRFDGNSAGLLPVCSLRYRIPLTEVVGGDYTGLVVIDCGENNVFGASFPISIE